MVRLLEIPFLVVALPLATLFAANEASELLDTGAAAKSPALSNSATLVALGRDLCNDGKWAEALPVHRQLVKALPDYPFGWMGLGWSLHYTGHFQEAIPAYEKAIELGAMSPHRPMLELARCHAALGDKDAALRWLERAMAAKLPRVRGLQNDPRLRSLADDPRFRDMVDATDVKALSRVEGWRHDLALLGREIKRLHYDPYRCLPQTALDEALRGLQEAIPALNDDEIVVRVKDLMRRLGDGHTYAEAPFEQAKHLEALPVLFGLFDDGLFITAVAPGHEDLLWAQVLKINQLDTDKALAALDPLASRDNPMRPRSVVPQLLRYPQLLHGLHLTTSRSEVPLIVRDREGRKRPAVLSTTTKSDDKWIRKPTELKTELPLHVRNRRDLYWFQFLPEWKLVYFQYNGCAEKPDESLKDFAERLFTFIDNHDVKKLVVDLRWNGGGNLFVNKPLLAGLLRLRKAYRPGQLFVIAGRHTFSAAMVFAAQIERYTDALFVGEPTGSSPNFVGETNVVDLPYSGMQASISNLYWQTSHAMDYRIWIDPQLPVPFDFASYRAGRDPALDAIVAYKGAAR